MGRQSQVWYRTSDRWWYSTIKGKLHKLSKSESKARELLEQLLKASKSAEEAELAIEAPVASKIAVVAKATPKVTLGVLVADYLKFVREHRSPARVTSVEQVLPRFLKFAGEGALAADLKGEVVTNWFRKQSTWGPSTRALALNCVKALLNHSVRQGLLTVNPLKGVKSDRMRKRVQYLKPELRARIRELLSPCMKEFFYVLEQTGARPISELAKLTAADVDWEGKRAELVEHKNKHKGLTRTLYFTDGVMGVLRRLAVEQPSGPLFRNSHGRPWTQSAVRSCMTKVSRKLKYKFSLYAVRHSFVVDALTKGLTAEIIAELIGSSAKIINSNYNHLGKKQDFLREQARVAVGETSDSKPKAALPSGPNSVHVHNAGFATTINSTDPLPFLDRSPPGSDPTSTGL